ncbi:MAG: hypothetical protein DYG88_00195 [Chloroflexi bacterium CFX4]|nr:hypothetical protein [Chloroflexi bacterium CFX4]MDL1921680.1 hypothetical protein [Chloroflexi bacterium CFX3]
MSRDLSIFIQAQTPLDVFAEELSTLLGITWQPVQDNSHIAFRALRSDQGWALALGTHTLQNDGDLVFEVYPYQIDIHTINVHDATLRESIRELGARTVFDQLKALGKYGLMLVENVQIKRDVYNPETEAHFHG